MIIIWGISVIYICMYHQSHSWVMLFTTLAAANILSGHQWGISLNSGSREQWLYTSSKDNSIKVAGAQLTITMVNCNQSKHVKICDVWLFHWWCAGFFFHTIDECPHGISFTCLSLSSWLVIRQLSFKLKGRSFDPYMTMWSPRSLIPHARGQTRNKNILALGKSG